MSTKNVEPPLLDPFAFPSETKGRFMMLTTAALACGANYGNVPYAVLIGNRRELEARRRSDPFVQQSWGKTVFDFDTEGIKSLARQEAISSRDSLGVWIGHLIFPCLTLLLLVALAAFLYRRHPKEMRLRYRTQPLTRAESPMVVADLEGYAERFGLRLPRLEYSPGLAQGYAFGVKGAEILLLHGTPAILENSWGPANRVIALHELAHIANADCVEREKAKSLWRALVVILFGGISLLWASRIRLTGLYLLQSVAMLIFVRALWAGLIRAREFYADWRVSSWGDGENLRSLLALSEADRWPWMRWGWWWSAWEKWGELTFWKFIWAFLDWSWSRARWLLRLHPSFQVRRKVLTHSSILFGISLDLPFLTGILLALVVAGSLVITFFVVQLIASILGLLHSVVLNFASSLSPGASRDILLIGSNVATVFFILISITALILIPSYFVTRTIGVQLQRSAVADMLCGNSRAWGYSRLLPTAFLLALGVEVGLHIAPLNIMALSSREILIATPIWLVTFTILLWLWLGYVNGMSRMLLGSYAGRSNPKFRQSIVTWTSVALLAILCWPAFLARLTLQALPLIHAKGQIGGIIEPRTFFVDVLLTVTCIVLVFSLVIYSVWVLASMILLRLGPLRRQRRCSTCGEIVHYTLSLGRRCRSCGESLTPWVLIQNTALKSKAKV